MQRYGTDYLVSFIWYMHYNSATAKTKWRDLSHTGILGRCKAGFALQVIVMPHKSNHHLFLYGISSAPCQITVLWHLPALGALCWLRSLQPAVTDCGLCLAKSSMFSLAHTSRLETSTQHAHSSKPSPARPQVPECSGPVQNRKTKQVVKSIILIFSTEMFHPAADQAL